MEGGSLIEEGPHKWSSSFDRTTLKIGVISGLLFIIVIYITANLLTALVPHYSCCATLRIRLQVRLFKFRSYRTKDFDKIEVLIHCTNSPPPLSAAPILTSGIRARLSLIFGLIPKRDGLFRHARGPFYCTTTFV